MASGSWKDLVGSAEGGIETVDDGIYDFVVKSARVVEARSGSLMLRTRNQILSGPNAGKPVFDQLVFNEDSPAGLGFVIQKLKNAGIDASSYDGNIEDILNQISNDIVGCTFTAPVGHHEWAGSPRNDIGMYQEYQGKAATPTTPAPATPTTEATAAPTTPTGDAEESVPDVPF